MANYIKWVNPNPFGEGQKIYRSSERLNIEDLPDPIAVVSNDTTEYIDTQGEKNNYYVIAVFRGEDVKYSGIFQEKTRDLGETVPPDPKPEPGESFALNSPWMLANIVDLKAVSSCVIGEINTTNNVLDGNLNSPYLVSGV